MQGGDTLVKFTPDRKAVYDVYVRNELIKSYDLTGLTFGNIFIWILVIVGILLLLYLANKYQWFKGGGGSKKIERPRRSPFEIDIPTREGLG